MTDPFEITSERKVLDWLQFCKQELIPNEVLHNAEFTTYKDVVLDGMVFNLQTYVLADKLVDKQVSKTVEVPASWWQHLKQDKLRFLTRRRPVKTVKHTFDVDFQQYNTYPKMATKLPKHKYGEPVVVEILKSNLWSE